MFKVSICLERLMGYNILTLFDKRELVLYWGTLAFRETKCFWKIT